LSSCHILLPFSKI